MKINDIYKNLEKTLNIKEYKSFLWVYKKLDEKNNIDSIKKELPEINFKKNKILSISKQKNDNIDWIKNRYKLKNLNLKKIIKNSKKIIFRIKEYIKPYFLFFKLNNKNRNLKILSYILLFFSFLLLDKIIIENLVSSWIRNLYNIKYTENISDIETQLSKAKTKFNFANFLFIPFKLIPEQNIININNWILVLKDTSQLWLNIHEFYMKNIEFIKNKELDKIYFANLIENSKPFIIETEKQIINISNKLAKINLKKDNNNNNNNNNNNIDSNYTKLENIKTEIYNVNKIISNINNNFETFLKILWKDQAKKYFIVFQNNDEIRPTWGFMWSAWILEIFAWKIKNFEKKDIYAYEWDVNKNYTETVKAPSWVDLLSQRLWLRDSNAFINFDSSAKSINYFMKKWWYDIDWVIFINQKIILDILIIIWEINFDKYNTVITENNFSEIISILVEAKVSKEATLDTPKQVLFDFSNLLIDKIKKDKKYSELIKIIIENINSRDLVIYNFNKEENDFLESLNLTWSFDYEKQTDFNYPFFISVWWNKTDRYISRKYIKDVKIYKNKENNKCNINTSLEVILENNFTDKDEERIISSMNKFRIKPNNDLINIAWKWINQSFTKILIPKNAIINNNDLNKYWYTLVNHWEYITIEKLLKTKHWEKSYFKINYKLENIDCNANNFKLYKQAWIYNYDIYFNYQNNFTWVEENIKLDWLKIDFYYN